MGFSPLPRFSRITLNLGVVTLAPANVAARWKEREREKGGGGRKARFAAAPRGDPQLRRHRIALTYITLCQNIYFCRYFKCSQLEGENTRGYDRILQVARCKADTSRRSL